MSDDASKPDQAAAGAPGAASVRLQLDAEGIGSQYANLCAVTPMPLEVVLDFVLMTGPPERQRAPLKVNNRVVLNYYSAKQLMLALRRAVERHEAMYGTLELDPRKRLTPAAQEMLLQQAGSGNAAPDDGDGEITH
ncbi:MAG: DUF3467 domain-containing protein [Phycisphaerae bacterium]|nr:DUF3467 domain-containing protein [Phycisphaerae bacterium]